MTIINIIRNNSLKLKTSLPHCCNDIERYALKFNKKYPRDFCPSARCVVFALNGNRIIEFGANERKTHPRYPDYKYSTHAEIKLLLNLKKDESKMKKVTDIVVLRGTSKLNDSFPCKICYAHLKDEMTDIRMWYYFGDRWVMEIL